MADSESNAFKISIGKYLGHTHMNEFSHAYIHTQQRQQQQKPNKTSLAMSLSFLSDGKLHWSRHPIASSRERGKIVVINE